MKLFVDLGNSRVKWTVDAGAPGPIDAAPHDGRPADLLASRSLPAAAEVWVASVLGPDHDAAVASVLARACGATPTFAQTLPECAGLRVAYAEPRRLGVDRWLGMLAVWTAVRGPFCVVNAGTALTFDAVDAGGRHRGGLIAPGLFTAQTAVLGATRFPVRPAAATYTDGLGTDTEACVRQGALHACLGLIERVARDAGGARCIGGGDAATLLPHLGAGWRHQPDLVLDGLRAFAQGGPRV